MQQVHVQLILALQRPTVVNTVEIRSKEESVGSRGNGKQRW
jgi:hypothetical protein